MIKLKNKLRTLRQENQALREETRQLKAKPAVVFPASGGEFKTIFDRAKDSILIETVDGRILDANQAACRMLGYTKEELTGLKVSDIVPEHIARELPDQIREASVEDGYYIESEQLLKSGRRIPVEVSTTLVEIDGQRRVIAILRDITDRKRAEAMEDLQAINEELQKRLQEHTAELARSYERLKQEVAERKAMEKELRNSEEKYRGLFNISPEGIMLFDLQGNVITGNDRICQLYGYSHDEMLQLSLKDIVPEELEGNFPHLVENLRKKGDLFFISQGKKRDGSIFPAELSAGLFLWKGEVSVQVLVRDITVRKLIEDELEISEQRLRSIIENSADGIMIIDQDGTVRFVNPATERLFDRSAKDFIGKPFAIPLTGGETAEITIEQSNRRQLTVEIRVTDIRWEGRAAYLATLRDVTARKELEKCKDDFIGTVSHEMRNPLAVLRVGIGQIKDGIPGPVNEDQLEILSITLREIDRLARLVDNLLDLSKIESGRIDFNRTLFDYRSLISDAQAEFRRTAEEKGLRLVADTPSEPILLYGDFDRLFQVLTNLVGNAFKFTPTGGQVSITAAMAQDEIECSVTDTGIGIPEKYIDTIFDKFIQCSYPNTGDAQGSGLGLAITRELVELHGGRIWVESKPEQGARFIFRIPSRQSERSLADHLDKLLRRIDGDRARFGLLGFRMDNAEKLKSGWGEKVYRSFAQQLFQRLAVLIQEIAQTMPDFWLIENYRSFAAVLDGVGPEKIQKIFQNTLRKLRKYRFNHSGRVLNFELGAAWLTPSEQTAAGAELVKSLQFQLSAEDARIPHPKSRGRVLIVDDEPTVVKILTAFLSQENIETEAALDGEQALRAVGRGPVDLIIIDMGLPKISGYEVVNQLRKNNRTYNIPLILTSGQEIDQVRLEKSGSGVTPILLEKPFNRDQVCEAVNRQLAIEDIQV